MMMEKPQSQGFTGVVWLRGGQGRERRRVEIRIEVKNAQEVLGLFGSGDEHLRRFRERFPGLRLVARGGEIRLLSEEAAELESAARAVRGLLLRVRQRGSISGDEVAIALGRVSVPSGFAKTPTTGPLANRQAGASATADARTAGPPRRHAARTEGQRRYLEAIEKHDIVFAIGPAGTGKTFLAVLQAVRALRAGIVSRIVLCRPAVEAGEKLGFLPGDFYAKVNPYLRPLYDSLNGVLDPETVRKLVDEEVIEIVSLAYMRGRTLNDAFIILDEAQNTTAAQMKMFLTRMGEGSRIVVTGDETQVDLESGRLSGLKHVQRLLPSIDGIAFHRMTSADIVRHALVWQIVEAYEKAERAASSRGRRRSG